VLILVRHGRTALNAAGRLQGRIDVELDEVGMEQARRIANAVGAVDRVLSSPLQRARQTAAEIGLPVEADDRWIELDYGELDGKPIADVGMEVWAQWRIDMDYVPAGGESLAALSRRVVRACEELLPQFATQDIVIASHVSPIKAAVAWALESGPEVGWRTHLDHGSITRIGVSGRGPILRSFNETTHLGAALGPVRISG